MIHKYDKRGWYFPFIGYERVFIDYAQSYHLVLINISFGCLKYLDGRKNDYSIIIGNKIIDMWSLKWN